MHPTPQEVALYGRSLFFLKLADTTTPAGGTTVAPPVSTPPPPVSAPPATAVPNASAGTAGKPSFFQNIGQGFNDLGTLDPRKGKGGLGDHVRSTFADAAATHKKTLLDSNVLKAEEELGFFNKFKPAWEATKSTATKFKNPLMAAGLMVPAAWGAFDLARRGVNTVFGGRSSDQPSNQNNVHVYR